MDPCPGTCGQNARCQVLNHNPICSCSPGFTGDPFVQCLGERSETRRHSISSHNAQHEFSFLEPVLEEPTGNPCVPSPCGPFSACRVVGTLPACSCLPNYIGKSPNCRPECTINAECPMNLACINEKCSDPCIGSCGLNSICTVLNHNPVCQCRTGFRGDPFSVCSEVHDRKNFILYSLTFPRHQGFRIIYDLFDPQHHLLKKNASHVTHHLAARTQTAEN